MKNPSESRLNTVNPAATRAHSPAPGPVGISGKRMTVIVLLTLLVTGALFYWVTVAYATYNAARRETDRSWRELAPELSAHYRAFDEMVAKAKDAGDIKAEWLEKWKAARDDFSSTSQSLHQTQAALRLEALIAVLPRDLREAQKPTAELQRLVANYSASAARQRAVGRSVSSWLLKRLLNLREPDDFDLASMHRELERES